MKAARVFKSNDDSFLKNQPNNGMRNGYSIPMSIFPISPTKRNLSLCLFEGNEMEKNGTTSVLLFGLVWNDQYHL